MAKKDSVSAARKAFVKARSEATGKTSAEDKTKFRARFETLAATKEGRIKIQQVTGLSGIRKDLAAAYPPKSKPATNGGSTGGGSTGPKTGLPADRLVPVTTTITGSMSASPTRSTIPADRYSAPVKPSSQGLSGIQKILIGGGAAAVAGVTLRQLNLRRLAQASANAPTGIISPQPQLTKEAMIRQGIDPKNKKGRTGGPRPGSLSAKRSGGGRGGARGGGGGGSLRGGGLDFIQ